MPDLPKILYIVHRLPYPPDKGDRIRTFHLLRFLSQRAEVHVACLADESVPEASIAGLRRYCERVAAIRIGRFSRWFRALRSMTIGRTATEGAFDSPALRAVVRTWAKEVRYQTCLASSSSTVPYLRLPELAGVPAVVDLIDVDSQKWFDYAQASRGPSAWFYRTEARRLRRLEQSLPAWTRGVTVVSEAEAAIYHSFAGADSCQVVPNGVDMDYFQPVTDEVESGCTFVGALDYRPNVDGICWFCQEVWPALRSRCLQAKLYVVGRRPAPAVSQLAKVPGVEVVGQVPDVRPFLARAAVAIVPVRIARGVQNKVLEALAMAKAVVASPQSLAGLQTTPGLHLLSAATGPEWVESVVRLFNDEALRRRLGDAGRRYVEANHRWEQCLQPFETILGLKSATATVADMAGTWPEIITA